MPKKRSRVPHVKPINTVHPSLQTHGRKHGSFVSSGGDTNDAEGGGGGGVNDIIQRLRSTQVTADRQDDRLREHANPRTVHPSLRSVMNVPDTPPPRPRPGLRVHAAGRRHTRGPAGPPPPVSWTYSPVQQRSISRQEREITSGETRIKYIDTLPGMGSLEGRSLYHMALRQLGRDWRWHAHYDQYYLATLPVWTKQQLLSSIARNSEHPPEVDDLKLLFLDESVLPDATGSEAVSRLDLLNSPIRLKALGSYLKRKLASSTETSYEIAATPDPSRDQVDSATPESWEDAPSPMIRKPFPTLRFPNLTHLSLASIKTPSWSALLAFLPLIATLTHLSLAHWPAPCLTPNSLTAYTSSPHGDVPHGGSNVYSWFDGDLAEPAGIMRRLSKTTYCLRWLDLSGCTEWVTSVLQRFDGPDWHGAWRGLEVIRVQQAWRPRCIDEGRWRQIQTMDFGKEASELRAWLGVETRIRDGVNLIRILLMHRNGEKTASQGEEPSLGAGNWNEQMAGGSWWTGNASAPGLQPVQHPSRDSSTGRRGPLVFDQGWDRHPQVKACVDAYLAGEHR